MVIDFKDFKCILELAYFIFLVECDHVANCDAGGEMELIDEIGCKFLCISFWELEKEMDFLFGMVLLKINEFAFFNEFLKELLILLGPFANREFCDFCFSVIQDSVLA